MAQKSLFTNFSQPLFPLKRFYYTWEKSLKTNALKCHELSQKKLMIIREAQKMMLGILSETIETKSQSLEGYKRRFKSLW